jgi:stage II sporulation protein D
MNAKGAWLAAVVFTMGCTVAGPAPGEPAPPARPPAVPAPAVPGVEPGVEPGLRVGLVVDAETARVEAAGPVEIVDDAGRVRATSRGAGSWTARRVGDSVEAAGTTGTLRATGSLVFRPTDGGTIQVDGRPYRGAVLLRPAATGVTVVNVLDVETYLLGVVPLEIGANRPPEELEAVKAQAIAARTYAIRHLGRRAALGFDVYATVMDQAYGGAGAEDPVSTRAVHETRGEVIVYGGEPIEAFYHSTCGGHTAALEEVWPGSPRPYLRAVSDAKPDGGWYCETSNRFRWTERWDHPALTAALSRGLRERGVTTGPVTRVDFMSISGRTPSGRAEALVLSTNAGQHRVRGDSIRWVLRPQPNRILNSAAITLETHGHGEVTALVVEGQGWGHGIGMCQVGAMGRARHGHSYRDILSAYYPGTEIARLYR